MKKIFSMMILGLLLFVSCPVAPVPTVPQVTTGNLSLTLETPATWAVSNFVIGHEFQGADQGQTNSANSLVNISNLQPGTHAFSVLAYDSNGVLLGRGSASLAIAANQTASRTISLSVLFVKHMYRNEHSGFTGSSNGIEINIGAGVAEWMYVRDMATTATGQYLWGMNAYAAAGDFDYQDFNFGFAIDAAEPVLLNEPGETLVFNGGASDLQAGILVFDGYEVIPAYNGSAAINLITRLSVRVLDMSGNALPLSAPADFGLDPAFGGVLKIGGNFKISISLNASANGGASWAKVLDVYNAAQTSPTAPSVRTDIGSAIFAME